MVQTLNTYNVVVACVLSVVGTVVIVFNVIKQFGDRKSENLTEAVTTWRALAEAREAEIADLKKQLEECEIENRQLHRRNEFLWHKADNK
jgi:flagellar biosynthesis/type III secretory pathway M-ring protein FliF/YscJ